MGGVGSGDATFSRCGGRLPGRRTLRCQHAGGQGPARGHRPGRPRRNLLPRLGSGPRDVAYGRRAVARRRRRGALGARRCRVAGRRDRRRRDRGPGTSHARSTCDTGSDSVPAPQPRGGVHGRAGVVRLPREFRPPRRRGDGPHPPRGRPALLEWCTRRRRVAGDYRHRRSVRRVGTRQQPDAQDLGERPGADCRDQGNRGRPSRDPRRARSRRTAPKGVSARGRGNRRGTRLRPEPDVVHRGAASPWGLHEREPTSP